MENMVATIGGTQLNVYDNEHGGDHLDLVSHYVHTEVMPAIGEVALTVPPGTALGRVGPHDRGRAAGVGMCRWQRCARERNALQGRARV